MQYTARFLRSSDRGFWLHLAGLVLLMTGVFASTVYGQTTTTTVATTSLLDRWLTPDVVVPMALALLYVGELRGELKRIKERLKEIEAREEKLDSRYVRNDIFESRLREGHR